MIKVGVLVHSRFFCFYYNGEFYSLFSKNDLSVKTLKYFSIFSGSHVFFFFLRYF